LSVKDLASKIGVSDRVVSSSVRFWESLGVLLRREEWEKICVRKRRVAYLNINWDMVEELWLRQKLAGEKGKSSRIPCFSNQIESLASSPSKARNLVVVKSGNTSTLKMVKKHKLNVSQRLFLITLLWMANPCGVVRGVGKKLLCQLTGASRERLDGQIEALLRKGYLLAYMPGGSGKGIEGVYTATYFVNVNHECFEGKSAVLERNGREFDFPVPRGRDLIQGVYGERFGDGHAVACARKYLESPLGKTLRNLISPGVGRYTAATDNVMGEWFESFWGEVDKSLVQREQAGIDDVLHGVVRGRGCRSSGFRADVSSEKDQILEEVTNYICGYIWAVARELQHFVRREKLGVGDECIDYIPLGCKVYNPKEDKVSSSPSTALLVASTSNIEG